MSGLGEDVYVLPASYAQERLWFLDQLQPGSAAYTMSMAVRLGGRLDVAALRQALNAVVARHEVLRTTLVDVDDAGRPHQVVRPEATVDLPVIDLGALGPEARMSSATALAAAEAAAPFDLAEGPLLRVRLLRMRPADQVLLVTMHHVISDGWSIGVFVRELGESYQAALRGEAARLPELPVQYADYAAWQREWLEGEQPAREIAYWCERLAGAPALLDLPTDKPRPAVQSYRGDSVSFRWPAELRTELQAFGREHGATLFMVLLAGFTSVLARFGAGDDIVVGTAVAGRPRPELEGLIGMFVNTLPLRTRLDDDPSFKTLVERVRDVCLGAYSHQELPFERLVEALQPERSLSHSPLVQALFALQNTPTSTARWPGLEALPWRREEHGTTAKFDLSLIVFEGAAGLEGAFEYNSDLFERATVERMTEYLRSLLEAALADPARPVSRLPLVTGDDPATLGGEGGRPAHPVTQGIHELFAAQARRTPDATAVVHADATLTFRELDDRSDRLARRLAGLGVGPETLVGLCLERSSDLITAMLAILKAGGGYLPLDPAYPPERLALMLGDARVPVIVTRRELAGRLPSTGVRMVHLDAEDPAPAIEPPGSVAPAQVAYVLYTSGSTGRPKGVVIDHANAVAMLDWARTVFPERSRAGVLATTSICFDLSVFEIFLPLCWGGTVVLVDSALELLDGAPGEVTLVNTVPSVLAELLRLGDLPPSVHVVCLAGEPLPRTLVDQAYERAGVERVYNLYGPSEAATYSTVAHIERHAETAPSIGRPITATQAYVLDRWLEPAPPGVAGDVYIGGAGVARGYLGRPGLTAERFVPDPFATEPGMRLYRTGDLARWRPDGELAFLGRADHQVKVRGFRIELGEVEAVLRAHGAIRDAVVAVREDVPGDRRLAAYVVPENGPPESGRLESELRARCTARLPGYMVPASFTVLDALPLNPNGKIDRAALPVPAGTGSGAEHTPPRTPVEAVIADVWRDVLKEEPIGVHDDFFALGGHSLLATQVVARLRATFGVDLALRAIFETHTVARLAEALVANEPEPGHVTTVAELHRQIDALSPEEILQRLDEE